MVFLLKKIAIAVDIGGTNTKLAVISDNKEVLHQEKFRTIEFSTFESYLNKFKQTLDGILDKFSDVVGLGIGAPNYNPLTGKLVSPPNLNWGSIDLLKNFSSITSIPIFMDNDANIAAIGEKVWGNAQDANNFIVITVGTGIGTGIFVNNKIVHGSNGIGGEGGHLIVKPDGRECGCGGLGHFESYCSVTGIKKTYFEKTNKDLTYREIVRNFQDDDKSTIEVFKETAKYFAIGLSQLTTTLSPKKVILIGGGMAVGNDYVTMVREQYQKYSYGPLKETPIILSEQAIEYGAILGCAGLVFSFLDS